MSETETVKLPTWLMAILVGILASLLSIVFAAGQALQRVSETERRLVNLEQGVHQLWQDNLRR